MERQPIDFVLTWVDGADPAWQTEKDRALEEPAAKAAIACGLIDAHGARYRDWDNLQYWFRGVEKYAPWVNRIYFVTWGHVPSWLNTEHPKLHIVRHEDYIPGEYLPTFSANPIELNLHRIEGLAEQFVFFNDDLFLTAPVQPEDFFQNGLPRDALSESPVSCTGRQTWNYIRMNSTALIGRHFSRREAWKRLKGKWFSPRVPRDLVKNLALSLLRREDLFGLSVHHLPQPLLKTTLQTLWELEPEWLRETSSHKFRDVRDVNQYIFKHYQLLTGQFEPYNIYKYAKAYCDRWNPQEAADAIRQRRYRMICLNDCPELDYEQAKTVTNAAFQEAFPEKSAFER